MISGAPFSESRKDVVIQNFIKYMKRKDIVLRIEIMDEIVSIGDQSVDPLIQGLNDGNDIIRAFSAVALGHIGNRRALEPLVAALRDPNEEVRTWSAWALGKIADTRAILNISLLMDDASQNVRNAALHALQTVKICENANLETVLAQTLRMQDAPMQVPAEAGTAGTPPTEDPMAYGREERPDPDTAVDSVRSECAPASPDASKGICSPSGPADSGEIAALEGPAAYEWGTAVSTSPAGSTETAPCGEVLPVATAVVPCAFFAASLEQADFPPDTMVEKEQNQAVAIVASSDCALEPDSGEALFEEMGREDEYDPAPISNGIDDATEDTTCSPVSGPPLPSSDRSTEAIGTDRTAEGNETASVAAVVPDGTMPQQTPMDANVRVLPENSIAMNQSQGCEDMQHLFDRDPYIQVLTIKALEEAKSANTVKILVQSLQNENTDIRIAAVRALGAFESPEGIEALVAAIHDQATEVQETAKQTLARIRSTTAISAFLKKEPEDRESAPSIAPLTEALSDPIEEFRIWAAWALGELHAEEAVPCLIQAIQDPEPSGDRDAPNSANQILQAESAHALVKIGKQAIEPLIAKLNDNREDFKRFAAAILVLQNENAIKPLIEALQTAESSIREEAVSILGKIGEAAVDPLIAMMHAADPSARVLVIRSLILIQDQRAVIPLIASLKDSDEDVRKIAAHALGTMRDARAIVPLIHALRDSSEQVRTGAVDALATIGDVLEVPA